MEKEKDHSSAGMKLFVVGAILAGLAAAYFFLTPKGKKNMKDTKSWAIKMKADVIEKIEQALEISESVYNNIIDSVASKYEEDKKIDAGEIKELANDLKKQWSTLSLLVKNKKNNSLEEVSRSKKKK